MTDDEDFSRRDLLRAGTLAAILCGAVTSLTGARGKRYGATRPQVTKRRPNNPTFRSPSAERFGKCSRPARRIFPRAEQLVAEEDAAGAYALVKEDIVTVPGEWTTLARWAGLSGGA